MKNNTPKTSIFIYVHSPPPPEVQLVSLMESIQPHISVFPSSPTNSTSPALMQENLPLCPLYTHHNIILSLSINNALCRCLLVGCLVIELNKIIKFDQLLIIISLLANAQTSLAHSLPHRHLLPGLPVRNARLLLRTL